MADLKDPHHKSNAINGYLSNGHTGHSPSSPNAWSTPGSAAFDFRSDTVTTPTASMLAATQQCTLLDDVFREDPTTLSLESHIASLTGKDAALFVISGTLGNQLSVRTHLGGPPHSILADARSHVIAWEAGGIASISGGMPIPVTPANGHHITLSDVQKHAILENDDHFAPTRLISLENTLGGTILPLSDCRSISTWARKQNPPIRLHLDGARLWEAVAAGAGSLEDYCACFDSVTMCFSKGLGAPIGSIIVSSTPFINRARHLRKMMGAGLRQAGVVTAPARVAVDETFLGGRLGATHELAREVKRMWEERGGRLKRGMGVETNMVWLDLEGVGVGVERFVEVGVEEGVRLLGGRVVCHYQICGEAVGRLGRVMGRVLGGEGGRGEVGGKRGREEVSEGVKEEAREVRSVVVE